MSKLFLVFAVDSLGLLRDCITTPNPHTKIRVEPSPNPHQRLNRHISVDDRL